MKYLHLYENFLIELKKYQSGKISILTDISQLPKVGVPVNESEFERDGIVAIDWNNIICVRSSNELPTISGKNLVCHTGRALKTVGFNKSFEDYLKKKYAEKDEPDNEYLRRDPNYKDFETFKKHMIEEEHGARWTKHFTINHVVSSHSGGSWAGNKFIYLTPGKEMIKVNGTPVNLYAIDTYWDKSIVLTDNTVILFDPSAKAEVEEFVNSVKETRNLIYFLEWGDKKTDIFGKKIDADAAIEAMGYSIFGGGTHYSVQDYLDDEIRDLQDKENIKMSGLHWGGKYETFEKYGYIDYDSIFQWVPGISSEDYYNFNDRVIKREESEYQKHRGFMKEALAVNNKTGFDKPDTILWYCTKLARAICTPKYAYYRYDEGNGMSFRDEISKQTDLLNWDIKKLETQLKKQEDENKKYSSAGSRSTEGREQWKKDYSQNDCVYVYFNKYYLNDLKISFSKTPFYQELLENKKEIIRLSELVERSENLTDEENQEVEKIFNDTKFGEFEKKFHASNLLIVDFFKNLNEGSKKFGFKDFFDMFSVR